MTNGNFPTSTIGWAAIVTGISAILAVIFITLMGLGYPSFGKVNDVFNSIIGISSAALAWMLFTQFHARSSVLGQIGLGLAMPGAIFAIIGSVLVIYGYTGFVLAGWYSGLGNALIGLWLLAFCISMQRSDALPHSLIFFGFVVGAFMALGLMGIPAILAKIDSMESMPWYLYIASLGWLGTYVLYPIWTIWLGRSLLLR